MLYDAIIIGRGPAGISCAIYTARANMKTLVIGKHDSALLKAEKIENYYGFEMPVSGRSLLEAGEKQALRLGAEIASDEAVGIDKVEHFTVYCVNGGTMKTVFALEPWLKAPSKIRTLKWQELLTTFFFGRNRRLGSRYADYAVQKPGTFLHQDITLYTNGMEPNIPRLPRNR